MTPLKTIFYTDDDTDELEFFKDATDELDVDINLFHNGKDMLSALELSPPQPSIVFIDLNMPVKNGYEIIQEMRMSKLYSKVPVVVLSTANNPECIYRSRELGANYYIVKPCSLKQLKEAIKHTLEIDWKNFNPAVAEFIYCY